MSLTLVKLDFRSVSNAGIKSINKVITYLVEKCIVFNHASPGEMHSAVSTATTLFPAFVDSCERLNLLLGHMAPDANRI